MRDKGLGATGGAITLLLHALVLWGLWHLRVLPSPEEAVTLFVNFIAPPTPKAHDLPKPAPAKRRPIEPRSAPRVAVVAASDDISSDRVPLPEPVVAIAVPAAPQAAGPVALDEELSVSCPERSPPIYPFVSRRLGEEGTVVLRVELDDQGRVLALRVTSSSGYTRLDDSALAAIRGWRCTPARRNGKAVHATALQPFKFSLQGK